MHTFTMTRRALGTLCAMPLLRGDTRSYANEFAEDWNDWVKLLNEIPQGTMSAPEIHQRAKMRRAWREFDKRLG